MNDNDKNEAQFYTPVVTQEIKASVKEKDLEAQRPFVEIGPRVSVSKVVAKIAAENDLPRLVVVAGSSGRTITDETSGKKVVYGGNLAGDIYGARDLKGSRQDSGVFVAFDKYGYLGLRVNGLKDNIGIRAIKKGSLYLRGLGLPTERPTALYTVEEIIRDGNRIDIEEWKKLALEEFARLVSNDPDDPNHHRVHGLIEDAKTYLDSTEFYIEERDLQVAERLRDIASCKSERDFRLVVEPILKWVNVATGARNSGLISGTPPPEKFSFTDEDTERYFGKWLPEQMGIYLGRLHNSATSHGYAHGQNWSAVGTLYDLDSLVGLAVDSLDNFSEKQERSDVKMSLGSLEELLSPDNGNYLSMEFGREILLAAKAHFIYGYLTERYGEIPEILDYDLFYDNTYSDGFKLHKRTISVDDWNEIKEIILLRDRLVYPDIGGRSEKRVGYKVLLEEGDTNNIRKIELPRAALDKYHVQVLETGKGGKRKWKNLELNPVFWDPFFDEMSQKFTIDVPDSDLHKIRFVKNLKRTASY